MTIPALLYSSPMIDYGAESPFCGIRYLVCRKTESVANCFKMFTNGKYALIGWPPHALSRIPGLNVGLILNPQFIVYPNFA